MTAAFFFALGGLAFGCSLLVRDDEWTRTNLGLMMIAGGSLVVCVAAILFDFLWNVG